MAHDSYKGGEPWQNHVQSHLLFSLTQVRANFWLNGITHIRGLVEDQVIRDGWKVPFLKNLVFQKFGFRKFGFWKFSFRKIWFSKNIGFLKTSVFGKSRQETLIVWHGICPYKAFINPLITCYPFCSDIYKSRVLNLGEGRVDDTRNYDTGTTYKVQ